MLFNSYVFVFLFLPLCLGGYFLLNRLGREKLALAFLFGMSLWFYAYFNLSYLSVMLSSIAINFLFYRLSVRVKAEKPRKILKWLSVAINLGILFYFKYYDFFLSNMNRLFGTDFVLRNILLPLGISFFTFQQLSFVVDAFNGEVPDYDFLSYACFVSFFPQLIAGPIVTHDELVPQLMDKSRKSPRFENLSLGLYIFAIGLAKKVLLADTIGAVTDTCYALAAQYSFEQINTLTAWLATLCFSLQIYFDFSGYSDMAIGIGWMFNMELPKNFDSPYRACSVAEHWKGWHLTLTRFFTKYVYYPLGGSRKGKVRTYFNIMAIYMLSGLWHGAGWNYVMWGTFQGIGNCLNKAFAKRWNSFPRFPRWLITFIFILTVNTMFRSPNLGVAKHMLLKMYVPTAGGLAPEILSAISIPEMELLSNGLSALGLEQPQLILTGLFVALCFVIAMLPKNSGHMLRDFSCSVKESAATVLLMAWCIMSFAGVSIFMYFNF